VTQGNNGLPLVLMELDAAILEVIAITSTITADYGQNEVAREVFKGIEKGALKEEVCGRLGRRRFLPLPGFDESLEFLEENELISSYSPKSMDLKKSWDYFEVTLKGKEVLQEYNHGKHRYSGRSV
jgi:hypothetical protein